MTRVEALEIASQTFGDPAHPAMLLIGRLARIEGGATNCIPTIGRKLSPP